MADREGFEPSVRFHAHTLSKRAHSTTLTPALGGRDARNSPAAWQSLFNNFEIVFCRPSVGGDSGEDPEQVREAIEEESDHFWHGFARLVESQHSPFCAAGNGAGAVERGARY
jgi:hypothetical protein